MLGASFRAECPALWFCAKRRDTESKNLSWMYDSAMRKSKRGPSTAVRARTNRGKSKDARNSAQDDSATYECVDTGGASGES